MKNKKFLTLVILFICIFMYQDTIAKKHFYRKGKMTRQCDPNSVETIKGEIIKIDIKKSTWNNRQRGIHLTVKTSKETIVVHLGPAWFINKKITLGEGDRVEIEGSRKTYSFKEIIIAKKIINGEIVLILRSDNGIPAWSGMGRRVNY